MAVIPDHYSRNFSGLRNSNLQYFGEALLIKGSESVFVVLVIAEGTLFLAYTNGKIRSSYEVSQILEIQQIDYNLITVRTGCGKNLSLKLEDTRPFTSTLERIRYEAIVQSRATAPSTHYYIPADNICTVCDSGGAFYSRATSYCLECDDKMCDPCWFDIHVNQRDLSSHVKRKLMVPPTTSESEFQAQPVLEQQREEIVHEQESPSPQRDSEIFTAPLSVSVAGYTEGTLPFIKHIGLYIPAGNDLIEPQDCTFTEALTIAKALPNCVGFSFENNETSPGKNRFFFKKKPIVLRPGSWTSYVREDCDDEGVVMEVQPLQQTVQSNANTHQSIANAQVIAPEPVDANSVVSTKAAEFDALEALLEVEQQREEPTIGTTIATEASIHDDPNRTTWLPPALEISNNRFAELGERTKMLLIACNYKNGEYKRESSMSNEHKLIGSLRDILRSYGVPDTSNTVRVLTDNNSSAMPTRRNIIAGMNWLTSGALPGSNLFFGFIGHGGELSLAPCDFATHGVVTKTDVATNLLKNLPIGCHLSMFCDFCSSGSLVELPHKLTHDSGDNVVTMCVESPVTLPACVVQFASSRALGSSKKKSSVSGLVLSAYVAALVKCKRPSYSDLLKKSIEVIRNERGTEAPVLEISSSRPIVANDEMFLSKDNNKEPRETEILEQLFKEADVDQDGLLGFSDISFFCSCLGKTITQGSYQNLLLWLNTSSGLSLSDFGRVYSELNPNTDIQKDYELVSKVKHQREMQPAIRELLAKEETERTELCKKEEERWLSNINKLKTMTDDVKGEHSGEYPPPPKKGGRDDRTDDSSHSSDDHSGKKHPPRKGKPKSKKPAPLHPVQDDEGTYEESLPPPPAAHISEDPRYQEEQVDGMMYPHEGALAYPPPPQAENVEKKPKNKKKDPPHKEDLPPADVPTDKADKVKKKPPKNQKPKPKKKKPSGPLI